MSYRLLLMSLLSGGLLVSCQGNKAGEGGDLLADNGGYSEGGFYGDASQPAPAGYPRDGEDFTTGGGVPFGHSDPVIEEEPVVVAAAPAPVPAPRQEPVVASRPVAPDRYQEAYAGQDSYGYDPGVEQAVVTPYVERSAGAADAGTGVRSAAAPKTGTASRAVSKATARTVAANGATAKKKSAVAAAGGGGTKAKGSAGAAAAKKSTGTVASTSRGTRPGEKKATGTRTGTAVKTVYKPPGKSKTTRQEKATVVRVHDIKRGDTLSKLATRYGVTVAHLKKRNGLTSDTIVLGKRLTID